MQSAFGGWLPEVVVWHPTRFEDGAAIVAAVRDHKTVLVHAGRMEPVEAQRLIDFVAGGVSAIDGQAEGVDALTFVFVPALVSLSQETVPPAARCSGL